MSALQSNIALVDESLRVGDLREAIAILQSLIDCCPNKILSHLRTALGAARKKRVAIAREYLDYAMRDLGTTSRSGVKTERLSSAGIHTLARITDDGDNSEPAKLCDTSLIQVMDDAGKEFVCLALEMDLIASTWIKIRKAKQK